MFNFQFNSIKKKQQPEHITLKPESDLNLLAKACKTLLKQYNEAKIRRAYMMCLDAHENKLRKSGEPYYTHPLEVARIVMSEIPLDDVSVISALLHDVLDEGDNFKLKDIRSEFGNDIADIVDGIHKIEHIENKNDDIANQADNYRKLLLSLFKDIRIILIKLADRLHNMRTLEYLKESSQKKLAQETLDIYAPFANRFGLRNIKWELEDLSFKYINPSSYNTIKSDLKSTREEREKYIQDIITPISERLEKDEILKKLKIKFQISGRPKHIYSIHNKMIARGKPMDELYDLFAIRILLDSDEPNICFYVYGVIAGIYQPVPETFKDYINVPKKNGYQSIHSAIVGHDKKIVELQIRTNTMHELAEQGFAAHFRYKGGKVDQQSILERKQILDWITEVREIFENAKSGSNEELIDNFRKNLFFDEIYVYTPKNEFRTLPKDSTPLDFAFDIHSEIGNHFIGAKVNGKLVAIDYKLQSGDQIEILTSKKQMPTEDWLRYVVTSKARQNINKYLKDKQRKLEDEGKEIWIEKSKEFEVRITEAEFEMLHKSVKFDTAEEFFVALAKQELSLDKAFEFLRMKVRNGLRVVNENREKEYQPKMSADMQSNADSEIDNTLRIPSNIKPDEKGKLEFKLVILVPNKITLLEQINTMILSMDEIEILEISVEEIESDVKMTQVLVFDKFEFAELLIENIQKVVGIKEIQILKN
ncbi:bifunctional (p)ppGpp synthetase/guanosine-3',5'-bis(diphosphate) 3'-pyrophosphohydrolase [Candidatus Kapaibacterium sp.]